MPKKKRKKSSKNIFKKAPIVYINILIISLSVIFLAILTNELLLKDDKPLDVPKENIEMVNTITDHERFEEKTKALEIEYIDDTPQNKEEVIKKQDPSFVFEDVKKEDNKTVYQEIKEEPKTTPIKKPIEKEIVSTKPKLSILIDDVTASWQVKRIQDVGYPITMAFIPPNSRHKNSAKIAQGLKNYMIHLPLEASSKRYEEGDTLHIDDSYAVIEKRIAQVKKYYPNAKYLNNHTGSKFTANDKAMDRLFRALKKHNLIFVDSRTTSKTVTKKYAKKYGVQYLSRNIFLDNKQDKNYIQKQLRKAIKIAKSRGQAIAIGHPHKITIQTLKDSKHLLEGLNVVYINKIKL
jgi:polysaccharide deacetylase 2 family uncharacterized protein YibQ